MRSGVIDDWDTTSALIIAWRRLRRNPLLFVEFEGLAGGLSVPVTLQVSGPGGGSLNPPSPVTIPGGSPSATTVFTAGPGSGPVTISVTPPAGYSTPTAFQSVKFNVQ